MSELIKSGETLGRGTYTCKKCGTHISIGETDKLPQCPCCSHNEYTEK